MRSIRTRLVACTLAVVVTTLTVLVAVVTARSSSFGEQQAAEATRTIAGTIGEVARPNTCGSSSAASRSDPGPRVAAGQVKEEIPVRWRPTMRVWMDSVPS